MLFIAPESCILFSDLNPDLTNELNDWTEPLPNSTQDTNGGCQNSLPTPRI
jgi:hypothetical protein